MKTLKNGLKQENIDSDNIQTIITNYSREDKVKIALYCAEDCFHPKKESQLCIDLVKKWLNDETSVTVEELRTASDAAANAAYSAVHAVADAAAYSAANAAYAAVNAANAAYAAVNAANAAYSAANAVADAAYWAAVNAAYWAVRSFNDEESKRIEYCSYARLFAYEDLSYPYKDFAKTFNLDNETDLNIFLDFLTDHYPETITSPREEFMKKRICKEYLRIIYQ